MLTFGCLPLTLTELGGSTAIVPSGKYLALYDTNGLCKVLERPTGKNILVFDGDDIYFADGGDTKPVMLPSLGDLTTTATGIVGLTNMGRLMNFKATGPNKKYLTTTAGVISWEENALVGVPATEFGVLMRAPYDDPDAIPAPVFLNDPGVVVISAEGSVSSLPPGNNGQQLTLVNQSPVWADAPSGSVSAGTSATGMAGIIGSNTSASVVNIRAASMTLDDGTGTTYRASNVNVSADLVASLGVGGLDVGSENANKWYYLYVISNGTDVGAIISENGAAPSFTNAAGYSFYALASVFRNDGSANIVKFIQKGRAFWTPYVVMSDPVAITTSYNPISQSVPMSSIVPPNVKTVSGVVGGSASASEGHNVQAIMSADNLGLGAQIVPFALNLASKDGFVFNYGNFYNLPILDPASPALYWKGSQASVKRRIVINGYEI